MFHTQFFDGCGEVDAMKQSSLFSHIHLDTAIDDRVVYTTCQNYFLQIDCFSYFYNWDVLRDTRE